MSNPDTPAQSLARELVPLVRRTGSFTGACKALELKPARAAYTLMKAGLYNKVIAAKYTDVTL